MGDPDMPTGQVDFRYGNGQCLMLFLDGHITPQSRWVDIWELEGCRDNSGITPGRGLRIRDLDSSKLRACPP